MNVLAVVEKPQVIPFKPQEVSFINGNCVSKETSVSKEANSGDEAKRRMPLPFKTIPDNRDSHFSRDQEEAAAAVIKVISAGGGGGNALNRMIEADLTGVEFIAVNTDIQDLYNKSKAEIKVQIGAGVTGGRGAGGKPEKGEQAALEDKEAIAEVLRGAHMVFITAGMGGGTGTGSAPVIAKIARQLGALTVAVVTTPFEHEGRYKMRLAAEGIEKLRQEVDTLIIIPNQYLFKIIDNTTSWNNAYLMADEVLCRGVQGISELITKTGFQNADFADVESIMKGKGEALMGIGIGSGENRALDAVKNAIDNPLLEDTSIEGATGALVNIAGPDDMTMVEIKNIVKYIEEKCDPEVNLIQGLRIDTELGANIQVTVIATGFQEVKAPAVNQSPIVKTVDTDFIDYNEYVKMVDKTKLKTEFLPPREYQDDLDVPSLIRNYNYHNEEKLAREKI